MPRRLFEKQPRWSFPQLQKDTHQPTQHLKEVLAGIAVKNPRGPYKDLWELKRGASLPWGWVCTRGPTRQQQRRACAWSCAPARAAPPTLCCALA